MIMKQLRMKRTCSSGAVATYTEVAAPCSTDFVNGRARRIKILSFQSFAISKNDKLNSFRNSNNCQGYLVICKLTLPLNVVKAANLLKLKCPDVRH